MIIANIGSMGVCKSATLIYWHLWLTEHSNSVESNLNVAFYDKNRFCIPKEHIYEVDTAKVVSRICKGVPAPLIDDSTEFKCTKNKINVFSVDESQFIGDVAFKKLIDRSKDNIVHAYILNTDYQNLIWPKTRAFCKEADFLYLYDGEFARNGTIRDTNYMFVGTEFELEYKPNVNCGFDGCDEDFWYRKSIDFFRKTLKAYDYDVDLMLKEHKGLITSFIKLFQLWDSKKQNFLN